MLSKFTPKRAFARAAIVVALGAASAVGAQTWNYQGIQNVDPGMPSVMGQISLEQVGGEYKFQMKRGNLDACYRSPVKASVERTPSTITITPTAVMSGCDQRFVLKADGTGGFRELLVNGQWRREEANRVLTLRK